MLRLCKQKELEAIAQPIIQRMYQEGEDSSRDVPDPAAGWL